MNDLKFTTAGDFLSQQRRIGFACKYMHPNRKKETARRNTETSNTFCNSTVA